MPRRKQATNLPRYQYYKSYDMLTSVNDMQEHNESA